MKPNRRIDRLGVASAVCCSLLSGAPALARSTRQNPSPTAPHPIYQQRMLPQEVRWFDGLNHLVDLHLKDATMQMAAEALSKASGVTIRVDPSVPKDLRLTLDAHQVPLATVLEVIGEQANLEISPDRQSNTEMDFGAVNGVAKSATRRAVPQLMLRESLRLPVPSVVVLKAWPNLTLNNQSLSYKSPMAPWDDVWSWSPAVLTLQNGKSVEIPDGFFAVVGINGNVVLGQRPTSSPDSGRIGEREGGNSARGGGFGGFGGGGFRGGRMGGGASGGAAGPGSPQAGLPGGRAGALGLDAPEFTIDAQGKKIASGVTDQSAVKLNESASSMSKSSVQGRSISPPRNQARSIPQQRDMAEKFHSDGPMTITRLSDLSFLITEPVAATSGEQGVILTIYELKNGQLQRVTGAYHPTAQVTTKQKKRP